MSENKPGGADGDVREQWAIELMDTTRTLLAEIANKSCTRDDVASTYGLAILSRDATDWPTVNAAIRARWSLSALEYIKRQAWKRIEQARGAR